MTITEITSLRETILVQNTVCGLEIGREVTCGNEIRVRCVMFILKASTKMNLVISCSLARVAFAAVKVPLRSRWPILSA